jgi:hypothetical protein
MEDEDEFVDAVEGTDERESVEDEDVEGEGFGDDEFGDFGEFTAEAEDNDEEVQEEYDPEAEEETRRSDEVQRQEAMKAEQSHRETRNLPPVWTYSSLINAGTRL